METTTTTPSTQAQQTDSIKVGEFGNGRYKDVQAELFRDTKRLLGFSDRQAHVTAQRLAVDLGRLTSGQAKVAYGKSVTKDGYRTVKEVCSVKMPESWAITIAVVCNGLDTLRKQGLETVENTIKDSLLESVNAATEKTFGKREML